MDFFTYRAPAVYNIVLKATDGGDQQNTAELTIKVNVVSGGGTLPSFQEKNYKGTLKDNTLSGQQIGEVTIKDNPQNSYIQYQILSGNEDNSFCIDYSGRIYAQKAIDFDTRKQELFELTIALMYGDSISASELWAVIPKANDNPPVFVGGNQPVVKVLPESAGELYLEISDFCITFCHFISLHSCPPP